MPIDPMGRDLSEQIAAIVPGQYLTKEERREGRRQFFVMQQPLIEARLRQIGKVKGINLPTLKQVNAARTSGDELTAGDFIWIEALIFACVSSAARCRGLMTRTEVKLALQGYDEETGQPLSKDARALSRWQTLLLGMVYRGLRKERSEKELRDYLGLD